MKRPIFLIGFMGAGKSSFGKRLAKKMSLPFFDSDREIERENGASIPELFEKIGEEGFRQLEREWLTQLNETAVVALGGGTPCFDENMALIREKGVSVYLTLPPKLLADRLKNAKVKRPLLEPYQGDDKALLNFIEETLEMREVFYKQAEIEFEAHSISARRLNDLIELLEASDVRNA